MPHSPRDLPGRPALHTQHPLLQPVIRLHTASLGPTSRGLDKGADHTAPRLTGSPAASPGPAQSPLGAGWPSRRASRSRAGLGLPGTALGVLTRPGLGTFHDTRLVAGTDWSPAIRLPFLPAQNPDPPHTPECPTHGSAHSHRQNGSHVSPVSGSLAAHLGGSLSSLAYDRLSISLGSALTGSPRPQVPRTSRPSAWCRHTMPGPQPPL